MIISCNNITKSTRESIFINQRLNSEVVNKFLKLDSSIFRIKGEKDFDGNEFKLITFLDSECNSCIQILNDWSDYYAKNNVKYTAVFLIQGNDSELFNRYIAQDLNDNFVFYRDKESRFLLNNNLNLYFQKTFLLNHNNQIKYVGSPVGDDKIEIQKDIEEIINSHD